AGCHPRDLCPQSRLELSPGLCDTRGTVSLDDALSKRPCVVSTTSICSGHGLPQNRERNLHMLRLWLPLLLATVSLASAQETRHFTFHYGFTVKNVPAGERVR